jgi:hypothetical protein
MKNENSSQINLAYLFLYNTDYGHKEGRVSLFVLKNLDLFIASVKLLYS